MQPDTLPATTQTRRLLNSFSIEERRNVLVLQIAEEKEKWKYFLAHGAAVGFVAAEQDCYCYPPAAPVAAASSTDAAD